MTPAVARKRRKSDTDFQALPHYALGSPTLLAQTPANANDERKPSKAEDDDWQTYYDALEQTRAALYTWRTPWWATRGQIARYMKPNRYYPFITPNQYNAGLRQDYAIVDRTATLAGETCAAGLMSGLTDPDRPWLKLGPAIPNFELDKQGRLFYDDLADRLRYIYDHSNFYESQAVHYDDLVFFGDAVVIDYESAETIIHCTNLCQGEYMLANGFQNTNEVLYDDRRQTIRQTVEMFGTENCPQDVRRMWSEKGGALEYENVIAHAIEPNYPIEGPNGPVLMVPGGFTWREVYWVLGKKEFRPLSVTGFHEKPFAVSRWNVQGNEPYGRGVGENMLGDCVQLQVETREKAESIQKVNRPPMGADISLQNLPTSTNPGKITYFNTGANGEKKFYPLYEVKPDINALSADIEIVQDRIRRTAYNHVFQPINDLREKTKEQVTAEEIDSLKQEQLIPLGPVIGRVYGGLRGRIRRHLAIMRRRGVFPRIPPSLRGVPLKIEFESILTQAQRATQTAAIARTFQFVGTLAGSGFPEARFTLNPEEGPREFAEGVGAPSRILRSPNDTKKLIAAEEKGKAQAQALAITKEGAAAGANLARTQLAPGNALSALVGGPQ